MIGLSFHIVNVLLFQATLVALYFDNGRYTDALALGMYYELELSVGV